jgi:hypothetical protein
VTLGQPDEVERGVPLTIHIRILGYVYTALAGLVGLLAVVVLFLLAGEGDLVEGVGFLAIVAPLFVWWLRTGLALLRRGPMARTRAIVCAAVLMIGLNGLFLIAGGEPFSSGAGWISFHVGCMAVGAYTLVIMLMPGAGKIFLD